MVRSGVRKDTAGVPPLLEPIIPAAGQSSRPKSEARRKGKKGKGKLDEVPKSAKPETSPTKSGKQTMAVEGK